jgi:hypothetical protein
METMTVTVEIRTKAGTFFAASTRACDRQAPVTQSLDARNSEVAH